MSLDAYLTGLSESIEDRQGTKKRMTVTISQRHEAILTKLAERYGKKALPLASKILEKALEDSERVLNDASE